MKKIKEWLDWDSLTDEAKEFKIILILILLGLLAFVACMILFAI